MAIKTTPPSFPHWEYFLAIEADLAKTSRYVECTGQNFQTYSIEFAHLLLAASSEVDVVAKLLCHKIDRRKKPKNIKEYQKIILGQFPKLPTFKARVPKYGLDLQPWDEWKNANSFPFWWQAYNRVKHQRDAYFSDANLKNVLNAFAGLFCLVIYFYGYFKLPPPMPQLFDTERSDPERELIFNVPDQVEWGN